ncbi:putative delta(7)-sterol 5(6)-desaturase [Helianthus anomalus]
MHIESHDVKPLYKWLHANHYIYNNQNTFPFFSLFVNKKASRYRYLITVILFFIRNGIPPYRRHIALLLMEAI